MKTVEVLFPELSNIYAENYNITYLERCNKNIKVIKTSIKDKPYFVNNDVDMVYIGSISDNKTEIVIKALEKYRDKIKELIEKDIIFLVTGNAIELFGKYIKQDDKEIKALNIFNYYTEKDMRNKHVSWFIGKYKNIDILGHRNQFSVCKNNKNKFIKVLGGYGEDLKNDNEGINYKNFYATYLLGPFLIMNPLFTKYLLKKLGLKDQLLFEEDIIKAYKFRLEHFKKENVRFDMSDHG